MLCRSPLADMQRINIRHCIASNNRIHQQCLHCRRIFVDGIAMAHELQRKHRIVKHPLPGETPSTSVAFTACASKWWNKIVDTHAATGLGDDLFVRSMSHLIRDEKLCSCNWSDAPLLTMGGGNRERDSP